MKDKQTEAVARLIGRRLREACEQTELLQLPDEIARKLAALREAEAERLCEMLGAGQGAGSFDPQG